MDEKLRILMQSENLTASKLAEILEVKPAAVSHILSGRNKPSFELLCKIVNRFPHINPYWLMGDATEMHNSNTLVQAPTTSPTTSGTLFDLQESNSAPSENSNIQNLQHSQLAPASGRADIEKIIIVYRDQTFEELRPKH
jgi:transcriptional regulator with XRE-family HTH domain